MPSEAFSGFRRHLVWRGGSFRHLDSARRATQTGNGGFRSPRAAAMDGGVSPRGRKSLP
ncbi:TPA: hypothetical protein ACFRG8_001951 [Neisseria lactamica]